MKKVSKIVSALAVSAVLALGAATAAFADVVFEDYNLTITGSGDYTATDLFDNFKNVMPGDNLDQSVYITNDNIEKVNVYLRAEAHDESSNPLTYSEPYEAADGKDQGKNPDVGDNIGGEGERDENVASMQDFLAQMNMIVTANGTEIFNDKPYLESGLANSVFLGELAPGQTMQLIARLQVPLDMGNEYANRVGEVDWVFVVEELDQPLPETGGKDSNGEDPNLPQTGDSTPMALIAGIGIAAILLAVLAFIASRRSRDVK